MSDPLDRMAVEVRADGEAFARDIADMRATLQNSLGLGAAEAGRGIESALSRAARNGRLEFEDLARVATRALGEVAAAALKVDGATPGAGLFASLAGSLLGAPGRATGGPVSPGRAYMVGERGPEIFVPTSSGRVEAAAAGGGTTSVRIIVNVAADAGRQDPQFLARTGQQVARALRRSLLRAQG
jgi:hypothetical protein